MVVVLRASLQLLCLLIISCGSGSSSGIDIEHEFINPEAPADFPQTLQEKIDAFLDRSVSASGPGLAVLVMHKNNIVYKGVRGMANTIEKQVITENTGFRLASVSKTFTALAIMQLYEQNVLELSDPITTLLPELPAEWSGITVHHLLSHRSGIPDYINDISSQRFSREVYTKEVMEYLISGPQLEFVPNTQSQYSNSGYLLLAQIVARISGVSFSNYIDINIFQPYSMTSSYIYDHPDKLRITNALSNGSAHLLFGKLWLSPGASSQVSSLVDFQQFFLALKSNQIVSKETFDLMVKPYSSNIFGRHYGYGFLINPNNKAEFGHEGLLGGFVPALRMDVEKQWYVVVLNNGAGAAKPYEIIDIVSNHFGEP